MQLPCEQESGDKISRLGEARAISMRMTVNPLGGRVDSIARLWRQTSTGVNVDDHPLALLHHGRGQPPHQPHGRHHVHS